MQLMTTWYLQAKNLSLKGITSIKLIQLINICAKKINHKQECSKACNTSSTSAAKLDFAMIALALDNSFQKSLWAKTNCTYKQWYGSNVYGCGRKLLCEKKVEISPREQLLQDNKST